MGIFDTPLTKNGVTYTPSSAGASNSDNNTLNQVFNAFLPNLVGALDDAEASITTMANNANSMLGALNATKTQSIASTMMSTAHGFIDSDAKISKELAQGLGQA